jgi:hypothetical protein
MNTILTKNPGPFSNLLINEKNYKNEKMRSVKSKKNNIINKSMSGKSPNIKLIDPSASNNIKIKNDTSINNVNLIRDSDSESVATAEPENDSESEASPIRVPSKSDSSKKQSVPPKLYSKMPTIDADEFKYFSNNKKQKPIIEKQESEDEYSEEEESDAESDDELSDSGSEPSVKHKKMSSREIEQKKQEILIKLLALEKKGVNLTKSYSLKSTLEELEFEYKTQQNAMEIEASVHFQQKILMAAVTGMEFLNKKFDPIGAKLDGWSESVMDNVNDYEEIFQKLHEKYSQKSSMPPELQLLVTLVGSGFMFHLTNSLFKSSLPGLGDVLKTNPDIMSNIMGAMGKAMNNTSGIMPGPPPTQQMPTQQKPKQQMPTMPDFTGPYVNLSSLLNTYQDGPTKPMMQQAPKMKEVVEDDRFSVASSSDYSEIDTTTRTVNTTIKGKGKTKMTGKSIKI